MKEYEYSFEVDNLEPYIKYCEKNNYEFVEENKQSRTIYRNQNKTIARITVNENEGKIKNELDFKGDLLSEEILKERRESLALDFKDIDAVNSILNFLNYTKDNELIRKRIVYKKDNVKFELDDYQQPKKTYVVGIEGEKEEVDIVYSEVKELNL